MEKFTYQCPICNSSRLILRYESSFVYSYILDSDEPGKKNSEEFRSYLYDRRELKENTRYIECDKCGTKYPYQFINGVLEKHSHDKKTILFE